MQEQNEDGLKEWSQNKFSSGGQFVGALYGNTDWALARLVWSSALAYVAGRDGVQEEVLSDQEIIAMANKAFGQTVDHDLTGKPITDYNVLLMGAYGPAVRRLVRLARANPDRLEGSN